MKSNEQRNEPTVEFLGEQDGGPERALKSRLSLRLARAGTVQRAFLARVRYDPEQVSTVVLALVASTDGRDTVVASVREEFGSLFNATQYLDIMFLSPAQEAKISSVCNPFFCVATSTTP